MNTGNASAMQLDIVPVSAVETEFVDWLFKPYIPVGKLTLLEGDPESGKTYVALALSAAVTTGRGLDFEIPVLGKSQLVGEPANVVYFSAEDGIGDTIKPRFASLGGDERRLHVAKDGAAGFTLSQIDRLDEVLSGLKPVLLVIDPLQAFLGANVDMHRANQVRPVLSPLSSLAEKHRCAILLIRHLNKSVQQKTQYRGMGSIDFTATARSVLLAGTDPRRPGGFALLQTKCSVARKGPGILYSIDDSGLHWDGQADLSASDLMQASANSGQPPRGGRAVEFLRQMLSAGPVASAEVNAKAQAEDISMRSLNRAKDELGVICQPAGFQGGWIWRLPPVTGTLDSVSRESSAQESDSRLLT
jgi:hypothetical protein